jgi:O-antigen/teichoic acid export membrane protein
MSLRRLGMTASSVTGIRMTGAVLQFVVLALYARRYDMAAVGHFAVLNAIWTFSRQVLPLGTDVIVLRDLPGYIADRRVSVGLRYVRENEWSVVRRAFAVVGVGALVLLVWPVVRAVDVPLGLLILGVPVYAVQAVYAAELRASGQQVLGQIPESVVLPGVQLLLLMPVWQLRSPSLALGVAAVVASTFLFVLVRLRRRRWALPAGDEDRSPLEFTDARAASRRVAISQIANAVALRSPVVLVSVIAGAEAAAIFEFAQRGLLVSALLVSAVGVVVSPVFAETHRLGTRTDLERVWAAASLMAGLPTLAVLMGAALMPSSTFERLLPGYSAALTPLVLLLIAGALNALLGTASNLLHMTGGEARVAWANACQALVAVGAGFALIPSFGVDGAAVAWLAATLAREILVWRGAESALGLRLWRGYRTLVGMTAGR